MENQEFVEPSEPEINFQSFHDTPNDSAIKREDIKDDYDVFLFAHLDNITNKLATHDLPLVQDVDMSAHMHNPSNVFIQDSVNNVKENMSPNVQYLQHQLNDENSTLHYVRYQLQDGKHVKIWECGICQKVFSHQYTLMRHLPTHTDERKFQCVTCGKAFRQMSTLSQHKAIHSTERPYVCEICEKTFNRVSTLISHRKTHTGLKPHRCHLCTKAFHQKGNLRNHIFTHTNERPYKCDICEKGFNQMSNLMCHKLKAHQRTEKPKYICQVCGKCFPKRVVLRQHEQYSHKMVTSSPPSSTDEQVLDKTNYTNAIIVDPIKTEAMRLAIESNQTPFALLRPVSGIPVLVRVLPAGDKQMLVPASAEDLKKHSIISIASKGDTSAAEKVTEDGKPVGKTVQIKIPVVATVIQQNDPAGQMSMSVVSPGPNGELGDQTGMVSSKMNNFVYSSTLTNCTDSTSSEQNQEISVAAEGLSFIENAQDINIEFLDERGRRIGEKDFSTQLNGPAMNGEVSQAKDVAAVNYSMPQPTTVNESASTNIDLNALINNTIFENGDHFSLI